MQKKRYNLNFCCLCNSPLINEVYGIYTCIQCSLKGDRWSLCKKCEGQRLTYHQADHAFILWSCRVTWNVSSKIVTDLSHFKTNLKKTHHDDPCSKCNKFIYDICWTKIGQNYTYNYHLCNSCFSELGEDIRFEDTIGWVKRQNLFNVKKPNINTNKDETINIGTTTHVEESSDNLNKKETNDIKEPYIPNDEFSNNETNNSYFDDYINNASKSSYFYDSSLEYSDGSSYYDDSSVQSSSYSQGYYISSDKMHGYSSTTTSDYSGYFGENKDNYEVSGYFVGGNKDKNQVGGYFGENKDNYEVSGYFGDNKDNYENKGYFGDYSNYENKGYFGENKDNYEVSGYFGENKDNYEVSGYFGENKGNYEVGSYFGEHNYGVGGYFGENKDNYESSGYFGENVQQPPIRKSSDKPKDDSRDWNEEFQILIKKFKTSTDDKKLEYAVQLNMLAEEFINTAVSIGKIIIEEVSLNARSKTVKPVSVGGIAGGEKYISKGIFFKFAIDAFGVYGGDEFAQKAASHELSGLKAYYNTNIEGLHTPFMLLMDYSGYRLIATTRLPIGRNSLIYGSADGGNTIKKSDEVFNDYMVKASKILNIKEHRVGIRNQTEILHAPTDIEGHLGEDGRYYVLDTARICPPEPIQRGFIAILIPKDNSYGYDAHESIREVELTVDKWLEQVFNILHESDNLERNDDINLLQSEEINEGIMYYIVSKDEKRTINSRASWTINSLVYGDAILLLHGRKGAQLFNLLRYELLKRNPVPLSSDAFTPFGRHNKEIHNKEVEEAFFKLLGKDIPEFVKNIESIPTRSEAIKSIHKHGINIRLIGFLRSHIPKLEKYFPIRQWLLMEMITRVTKNYLREQLRRATLKREPLEPIIVERFNLLLGESYQSNVYWGIVLKAQLLSKFGKYGQSLTPEEIDTSYNLKKDINKLVLFQILQKRTGVKFNVNLKFQMYPELFESEAPFDVSNVESLSIHKKHLLDPEIKEYIQQKIMEKSGGNIETIIELNEKYMIKDRLTISHLLMIKAFNLLTVQESNDFDEIISLCKSSLSYYQEDHWFTPVEITLRAYYIYACIHLEKKEYSIAEKYLYALYESLLKMYNYKNDLIGYSTTHPFVLLVLNKLVQVLLISSRMLEAFTLSYIFKVSWTSYPFKGNLSKLTPYFGNKLKFILELYRTSFFNINREKLESYETTESNEEEENRWIKNLTMEEISDDLYLSPKVIDNFFENFRSTRIVIADKHQSVELIHFHKQPITWPIQSLDDFKHTTFSTVYQNHFLYIVNTKDISETELNISKYVELYIGEHSKSQCVETIWYDNPNAESGTYIVLAQRPDYKRETINLTDFSHISYPIHVIDPNVIHSALLIFLPQSKKSYYFHWDRRWDNKGIQNLCIASNEKETCTVIDDNGTIWYSESINKGPFFDSQYNKHTSESKKIAKLESYKSYYSSSSSTHNLILLESGEVFSYGINQDGQLGLGDNVDRFEVRLINKLKGIKIEKIFAYTKCSMAIDQNGILYQWGYGFSQYPEKNTYFENNNIKIIKGLAHWNSFKAAMAYYYVTDEGCLYNSYYSNNELVEPFPYNYIKDCIVDITCNDKFIFLLTSNGEVYKLKEFDGTKFDINPVKLNCYDNTYFTSIYSTNEYTFAINDNNDLYMIGPRFSESFMKLYLAGFKVNQFTCSHNSALINIVKHKEPIPHHPLKNKERPFLIGDRYHADVIKGENDDSFKIVWEKPMYIDQVVIRIVEPGKDTIDCNNKAYLNSCVSSFKTQGELYYSFSEKICGTHEYICPLLNGEYEVLMTDTLYDDYKVLFRSKPFSIQRSLGCTIKFSDNIQVYTPTKISYHSRTILEYSCICIYQVSTNTLYNIEYVTTDQGEFEYTFYFDGEFRLVWQSNYGDNYQTYYSTIINVSKPKIVDNIKMKIKTTGPYYTSGKIDVEWEFEGKVPFSSSNFISLFKSDDNSSISIASAAYITPFANKGVQKDFYLPSTPGEYQWRYRMMVIHNNMTLTQEEIGPTITVVDRPEEEQEEYEVKIEIIEDSSSDESDQLFNNWKDLFIACNFETEDIEKYTNIMETNNISISLAHIIDFSLLKEFDIPLPHRMKIMQQIYNIRESRIKKYIDEKIKEK